MLTLENRLNKILNFLPPPIMQMQDLLPLLDLPCLNDSISTQDLQQFINTGIQQNVAALCLYAKDLNLIPKNIKIKTATVVNFPHGNLSELEVLTEITNILRNLPNIDEIDYVFPYQDYLAGKHKQALQHCFAAYNLCQQQHKIFKVILETGAISNLDKIYEISRAVLEQGCDFLKTSTGKIPSGASIPAVFTMLTAIIDSQNNCGIKISGGIRTLEQAAQYINLAEHMLNKKATANWFRIGTSTTNWNI
jgi:deoxyribose-phosphate aldolase